MIKELNQEEFEATISQNMRLLAEDDTTCAEVPLVEYVERCIGFHRMDVDVEDAELHYAYMNDEKHLCHVGFNFGDEHLYLVLVVDADAHRILGHCVLDFSKAQAR